MLGCRGGESAGEDGGKRLKNADHLAMVSPEMLISEFFQCITNLHIGD